MTRPENPHHSEQEPINPQQMQGLMKKIWKRLDGLLKLQGALESGDRQIEDGKRAIRDDVNRMLRVSITTDVEFVRKVMSAFEYLIPNHDHLPFPELKELFSEALKHDYLQVGNRSSSISIIPATREIEWGDGAERGVQRHGSLRELFEEQLGRLSISSIKAIRRVSLFRLIEQARPQGIQSEVISLMGLMIDTLDQMMLERIQRFHRHDPEAMDAHQQLMTQEERLEMWLPSATADLLPLVAAQPEDVAAQEWMKQRYNESWDDRREMTLRQIWPIQLPAPLSSVERDFESVLQELVPKGLAPGDFFDDRYYLWGIIDGARDDRNTILQELQEVNPGGLREIQNPLLGSFEGNTFDMQLMSIPGFMGNGGEYARQQLLRGFINRVMMFMMPSRWFEPPASGKKEVQERISESELWWMYGELKDALEDSEDLEKLLSKMFPGIDHHFLMKPTDGEGKNERVRKRFEWWARASEEFFNEVGRSEIAIVLETFFYSLAYKTREEWREANLFFHLKTAWQDLDDQDLIEEAREEVFRKGKDLNGTLREYKKTPKRLEKMPFWFRRWREHDARFRLEVLEAVVKRDPRLENQEGKVVLNGASFLPFSEELPHGMFSLPVVRGAGQILWVWWPEQVPATL